MIVVWQSCARPSTCPDCSLTSGDTVPIMPRQSVRLPSAVASVTIYPECCLCSSAPKWYQHIVIRALISMEVLICSWSQLCDRIVHNSILQGVFNTADDPIVFVIVASYSRDHAPSWRQTSSVLCIMAPRQRICFDLCRSRLAIMSSGTSCPRPC